MKKRVVGNNLSKIFLISLLFLFSVSFITAIITANTLNLSEEESNPLHLGVMFGLLVVILFLVQLSFKAGGAFKEGSLSFSFKTIALGLIILGVDRTLSIAEHLSYIKFDSLFDHLLSLVGFLIIGVGLFVASRNME